MTAHARRRGRAVRRGHHERGSVGRRLRLRERRARAHRGRRRVGASRVDWYQVAIKPAKPLCFGDGAGHAGVRAARQPGVVARELRALRPARAAADDGPRPRRSAARSATAAHAFRRRVDGKLHLDRVVVDVRRRRATWRPACGSQESNALAASAAANGFALLPDGEGVDSRRPRHRDVVGVKQRESARRVEPPGARLPARPETSCAAPTSARLAGPDDQPVCTCSPRGASGCSPAGTFATKSDDIWTSPFGDDPAAALHDCRAGRCLVGRRRGRREAATREAERCGAERHGTDQESPTLPTDLLLTHRHLGCPFRKQTTGPPDTFVGSGAGFALAPRRLKRPIRRLRIDASP